MPTINFITVSSLNPLTHETVNRANVQHVRNMSVTESLDYFAEETGYKAAQIKAAILGWVAAALKNAERGVISLMDGVVYIAIKCKGAFSSAVGPWVKGVNYLELNATELNPWKSALSGCTVVNQTEGLKPIIDSVLDLTTGVYDVITGLDPFSIGGNNLAPDPDASDEGVFIRTADGVLHQAEITLSDLGCVKARLSEALTAGEAEVVVKTRCGLDSSYEVKEVTRKINLA